MTKDNPEQARHRAETSFKKKEAALMEGQKAMEEYRAGHRAMQEKTARPGEQSRVRGRVPGEGHHLLRRVGGILQEAGALLEA